MTILALCLLFSATEPPKTEPKEPPPPPGTMAAILAGTTAADWRGLDPENTLYLDLAAGRVVIELAPLFAEKHVQNIKALVRESYFDGLAFMRSQDNYVVQFGDADAKKPVKTAQRTLEAEFWRDPLDGFVKLPDPDVYAKEVGFAGGMPAARDAKQVWLSHCYGMVGAGRDEDPDSGGGIELYVVIGHAPRHLDRNVTLVGRVVQGMELLSTLPRGTGALGFYEKPEQRVPLKTLRVAADVPADKRVQLELLRTDTKTFTALLEARRVRKETWYKQSPGKVELCNVPLPVRMRPTSAP